jgi:hypothetical protein
MSKLELQLPEPLASLKICCEVHCVPGCCGLEAFEIAATNMVPWFQEQSLANGILALTQLELTMATVGHHSGEIWSINDFGFIWKGSQNCLTFLDFWFGEATQAFREVAGEMLIQPAWLTATVVGVALSIRAGAFDRLPILADALEDAGCTNADILNHCRQPGEHVRGCWAVDLVLGKK